MTIPKFEDMMYPILQISNMQNITNAIIRPHLKNLFNISDNEMLIKQPTGPALLIVNRIAWAFKYLKEASLIKNIGRGEYVITESGKKYLDQDIGYINEKNLYKYTSFIEYLLRSKYEKTKSEKIRKDLKQELDELWDKKFNMLYEFVNKYDFLPDYSTDAELDLWINQQKEFKTHKKERLRLSEYKIEKLETIQIWNWEKTKIGHRGREFDNKLKELEKIVSDIGFIPDYDEYENKKIIDWIYTQKDRKSKNKLSQYEIIKLERINHWNWDWVQKTNSNLNSDNLDIFSKMVNSFILSRKRHKSNTDILSQIIFLRFENNTLEFIGNKFNLTRERIRQQTKAFSKFIIDNNFANSNDLKYFLRQIIELNNKHIVLNSDQIIKKTKINSNSFFKLLSFLETNYELLPPKYKNEFNIILSNYFISDLKKFEKLTNYIKSTVNINIITESNEILTIIKTIYPNINIDSIDTEELIVNLSNLNIFKIIPCNKSQQLMKGTWILDSNANANEIIISSAIIYNNQNNPNLENNIRSTFYASDLDILLKVNEAKLENNSSKELFNELRSFENVLKRSKKFINSHNQFWTFKTNKIDISIKNTNFVSEKNTIIYPLNINEVYIHILIQNKKSINQYKLLNLLRSILVGITNTSVSMKHNELIDKKIIKFNKSTNEIILNKIPDNFDANKISNIIDLIKSDKIISRNKTMEILFGNRNQYSYDRLQILVRKKLLTTIRSSWNVFFSIDEIEKIKNQNFQDLLQEDKTNTEYNYKTWEEKFSELSQFINNNNSLPVDGQLYRWCYIQRRKYHQNTLIEEHIEKLERLPQWYWGSNDILKMNTEYYYNRWGKKFSELSQFINNNNSLPEYIANSGLYQWCNIQRRKYHQNTLIEEHIEKLEKLPHWYWKRTIQRTNNNKRNNWNEKYTELLKFIEDNNSLPKWTKENTLELKLYNWCYGIRKSYSNNTISEDNIKKFEELPIWSWEINKTNTWDENYAELLKFIEDNNSAPTHKNIPNLYSWWRSQVRAYNTNQLNTNYIKKFEELPPWIWDGKMGNKRNNWDENYLELLKFIKLNNTFPDYENGNHLYNWISRQKRKYNSKKLKTEHIGKLEAISSWSWENKKTNISITKFR